MKRWLWIGATVVGISVGCLDRAEEPADYPQDKEFVGGMMATQEAPARVPEEMSLRASAPAPGPAAQSPPVTDERKLIRNGSVGLEVTSVDEAVTEIKKLVDGAGGYITDESVSEDEYGTKSGSVLCRVPADDLDPTLAALSEIGDVEYVSISANDITDQYFDLEVRLNNQKQLEARLVELLKRPTNELDDLLAAERELARVRTDIDSMEGTKRLWDNQIAYSTISVNLHEPAPVVPGGGVFRALWSSFGRAGENFVLTVAGLIASTGTLLPIALAALVVFWGGRKVWRRRKKSSAS
ncbi:MAG: DUF4349 domain-containing protein [Vicinamibacteria bacterium]